MDAKIRARAHQAVCIGRSKSVFGDQPVHELECRGLDSDFKRTVGVDGDERTWFLNAHPGNFLCLDHFKLHANRRLRLGGGASKLRVALARVDVAQVEECSGIEDW